MTDFFIFNKLESETKLKNNKKRKPKVHRNQSVKICLTRNYNIFSLKETKHKKDISVLSYFSLTGQYIEENITLNANK